MVLGTLTGGAAQGQRFVFKEPAPVPYEPVLEAESARAALAASEKPKWLAARVVGSASRPIQLGHRVVLRVAPGQDPAALLAGSRLRQDRQVGERLYMLEAGDALEAAEEATRLAALGGVEVCHPVRRRPAALLGGSVPPPNDPLLHLQYQVLNRDTNHPAIRIGEDLNLLGAWQETRGGGQVVAVVDNGVETTHPDLTGAGANSHHRNFVTGAASAALGGGSSGNHGTAVAGLLAATANNRRGVVGVAPEAHVASWTIFDRYDYIVDEEQLMEMYQYRSNAVSVQNHSWGVDGATHLPLGTLEDQGIENAVRGGRGGRGVIMVRAGGNYREEGGDVNDDGAAKDPRAIAVAAVRRTGRVASFSSPGAPLLVAAFSGDSQVNWPNGGTTNFPAPATTDRQGSLGWNYDVASGNADYAFGASGFDGTSAAAPQIAGLCALVLSVNPRLTYRDVQQVLVMSARPLDGADPDVRTNGAGFRVSHNTGFGVPDAGLAVRLAREWVNRPPRLSTSVSNRQGASLVDDGLRVEIEGEAVPAELGSIPASPSETIQPDEPTERLPLVDVGQALEPIQEDLTGKAALIQRGVNYFTQKLAFAADAGARFAIVYNNRDQTERIAMGGAELHLAPIPAVFIDQNSGEKLRDTVRQTPGVRAQIRLRSTAFPFTVTTPLLTEHVRLRVSFDHARRGQVRVTLVSPSGTRSVLQRANAATDALDDWDYYSTQHFFEGSTGVWRAEISDEGPDTLGRVISLELTVWGVAIEDSDGDGLDDGWERQYWGDLGAWGGGDADGDGYTNAQEQILGWNPRVSPSELRLEVSPWNAALTRLSWLARPGGRYELLEGTNVGGPFTAVTNLSGRFPEWEWFVPTSDGARRFFQVREEEGL